MSGRPAQPTGFELQILREVAGEAPPTAWGASVSVALEWLHGQGYVTSTIGGVLTDKGRKALGAASHG